MPNSVYTHGTEITARGAFSYRVGMTMAEWICRGWLGLGPTTHAEAAIPPGADHFRWEQLGRKPDLFGTHRLFPRTWLIEAKAARRLGKSKLAEGAAQLASGGAAHGAEHRKLLCGTSLEDQLFVMVEIEDDNQEHGVAEQDAANPPDPAEDDDVLYALARSRMLTYLLLRSAPHPSLRIAPVSMEGRTRASLPSQFRSGESFVPLEQDPDTRRLRSELRRGQHEDELTQRARVGEATDMLTAPVPGTDLFVGMSRRLFGACRALIHSLAEIGAEAEEELAQSEPRHLDTVSSFGSEARFEARRLERSRVFRQLEEDRRLQLTARARNGFDEAEMETWRSMMDVPPQWRLDDETSLLEGAARDTYLAIDPVTVTDG